MGPVLSFALLDVVWWVGSVALGGVAGWLVALFEYETDDGQVLMAVLLGLAGAFVFVATQVSWGLWSHPLWLALGGLSSGVAASKWVYPYLRG